MAQAGTSHTLSTFIAQLLAPLKTPPVDRVALREARRDLEDAWSLAHHRYWAAHALREHYAHQSRAAEIERRTLNVPERENEAQAQLALLSAIDRLMCIPAPTIGGLRQKQKLRSFSGGRERWEAAIADDIVRLGASPTKVHPQ